MRALRLALRRLAQAPGFAIIAIFTLALGIGANTAIFSLVDGVLLRPLTFPHPEQLVALEQSIPEFAQKFPAFPVNARSFFVWRRDSKLLAGISILQPNNWVLSSNGSGSPTRISGAMVSAGIFRTLGVTPLLGRGFLPEEDLPGKNYVVMLSNEFWRSQFHSDPSVIGRIVDLDGHPNQIVGVLPESLHFPHGAELGQFFAPSGGDAPMQVFQPLGTDVSQGRNVGNFNYLAIVRMKPGVNAAQLKAEFDVIEAAMLSATHAPADIHVHTIVTSLRDSFVGSRALGIWMLLAAVAAILLIVCLNLANLLLVRVHGQGQEIAIRVALGASRGRLMRETVLEALLLAAGGGLLGVLAAEAALHWLVHAAPAGLPRLDEVSLNPAVLAFALLLALACGMLFSIWPAMRAARTDPQRALRSGGRSASDSGQKLRLRSWLVGAQAALAALLLIVAGLLVASYMVLLGVNTGFQPQQRIEATVDWPGDSAQRSAFLQTLLERLQVLPGIQAAGLIDSVPTQGVNDTDLLSYVHDTRPLVQRPLAAFSSVSADYFAAMGIPIVRGRTFTAAEMAAAGASAASHSALGQKPAAQPPVAAVVSEYTAGKIWPGKDPIGQQFALSDPEPVYSVVGVAADVRARGLEETPGLAAYWPYTLRVPGAAALILRTSLPIAEIAPKIRQAVWSVKPDAAVPTIKSMDGIISESVAPRRFQLTLVLFFAACALLLAALGIYGVVAYSIERRTTEIGLRMALGASSRSLIGMVMRQGLTPVLVGLLVGAAAAVALGRMLASLLFGVQASNPAVIAAVSAVLLVTGALACAVPARRATRIDPMLALRP